MRASSEARIYALGVILCATLIICSRNFGDRGGPRFIASLAVSCIAYLFAIREFLAKPKFPRRLLVVALLLAAAWQVAFLRVTSGADDDIHRYVWDGRLQRLGLNPYIVIPSDPAVKQLHTPETRTLNNPDLPSPYPPGAQLFFRAITAIRESTFAMKIAFVICDWLIVLVLVDLLRLNQQGAHLVLAYAWNPLLAVEVAGSGHVDIVGALLLVVSIAALARRWRATAAVALALAVSVKFLPIVLVPLYWRRVRIRDAGLGAAVLGLLYVPFLYHGHIPTGSLATYVQTFRFNGPIFAPLARIAPPALPAGLAVLAGLVTAMWLQNKMQKWTPNVFAWPMAASLLCAPAVFPWYLLWLLPFLTSSSTFLLVVWSVSIIPVYVQWHLRTLGHPWGALPGWVMVIEYGCVAIAGVIITIRKLAHAAKFERQMD